MYTKVWLTRVPLPFWEQILTWGKSKFTFSHISITHFYLPKYLLNIYWVKLQFKKIAAVIARNSKYCDIFFLYYRMLYLYLIFCSSALPRYKEYHDRCSLHNGGAPVQTGWEELLNKVFIFVFFAHKKYFRSFIKLQLNPWCDMDCFTDVLATLLGTLQLCCCQWRVRELSDFIKNILICVPKMNKGRTGLERHEGK